MSGEMCDIDKFEDMTTCSKQELKSLLELQRSDLESVRDVGLYFASPLPSKYARLPAFDEVQKAVYKRPSSSSPDMDVITIVFTHSLAVPTLEPQIIPLRRTHTHENLEVKKIPVEKYVEVPTTKTHEEEVISYQPVLNSRWVQRLIPSKYTHKWKAHTQLEQYWGVKKCVSKRTIKTPSSRFERIAAWDMAVVPVPHVEEDVGYVVRKRHVLRKLLVHEVIKRKVPRVTDIPLYPVPTDTETAVTKPKRIDSNVINSSARNFGQPIHSSTLNTKFYEFHPQMQRQNEEEQTELNVFPYDSVLQTNFETHETSTEFPDMTGHSPSDTSTAPPPSSPLPTKTSIASLKPPSSTSSTPIETHYSTRSKTQVKLVSPLQPRPPSSQPTPSSATQLSAHPSDLHLNAAGPTPRPRWKGQPRAFTFDADAKSTMQSAAMASTRNYLQPPSSPRDVLLTPMSDQMKNFIVKSGAKAFMRRGSEVCGPIEALKDYNLPLPPTPEGSTRASKVETRSAMPKPQLPTKVKSCFSIEEGQSQVEDNQTYPFESNHARTSTSTPPPPGSTPPSASTLLSTQKTRDNLKDNETLSKMRRNSSTAREGVMRYNPEDVWYDTDYPETIM